MSPILAPDAVARALAVRDLTDPYQGPHAVQRLLDAAAQALTRAWKCEAVHGRASPVVPLAPGHGSSAAAPRVSAAYALRTSTSEIVPALLERVAAAPPQDVLLVCPGVVYRRDPKDGNRARASHQVDLWRIRRGPRLGLRDLAQMIGHVTRAVAPGFTVSPVAEDAREVLDGRRVDLRARGEWVEVGHGGLAPAALLAGAGLPPDASGIALALDLDRLVMLAKGIDDERLLRSHEPRIAAQMLDLGPFIPAPRDGARQGRRAS